jgi:hypothetical protein
MKRNLPVAMAVLALAFALAAPMAAASHGADVSVDFRDCVESIGVTLVSTDEARASVPPGFVLAGEGSPVTPAVVRTSRCQGISVDGAREKAGAVVQIGLVLVPPDFTGDINNFTLWYYTSDAKLAHALTLAGVDAQHVPTLAYAYVPQAPGDSDPLAVVVPKPGRPQLAIAGHVTASDAPAGSFEANWWAQSESARVKMDTAVPVIFIGSADLTLLTNPSDAIGQLFGGGSVGFPILQQFNTFAHAHMSVTHP